MSGPVALPTSAEIDTRLAEMLAADSAQTGGKMARLMVMLTRSCELRCAYCFVALSEDGYGEPHPGRLAPADGTTGTTTGVPRGDLAADTARRAVDRLLGSPRPRLGLQLFGGEPTRCWDTLVATLTHAVHHPARAGRPIEVLLTTNGLGFDTDRLAALRALARDATLIVQLSVDGWGAANRFRRPHLLPKSEAEARWEALAGALDAAGLPWFLNVTVPPAAAGELLARYEEARARGVPALQLNYATGMAWSDVQVEAWLTGMRAVFAADRAAPGALRLYNWQNAADPAPLCGDTLVDVDGTLLQVGGVFHERRFPALRAAYRHGHVEDGGAFVDDRATLAELWRRTEGVLTAEERGVFLQGMRLGAATDLLARRMARAG